MQEGQRPKKITLDQVEHDLFCLCRGRIQIDNLKHSLDSAKRTTEKVQPATLLGKYLPREFTGTSVGDDAQVPRLTFIQQIKIRSTMEKGRDSLVCLGERARLWM